MCSKQGKNPSSSGCFRGIIEQVGERRIAKSLVNPSGTVRGRPPTLERVSRRSRAGPVHVTGGGDRSGLPRLSPELPNHPAGAPRASERRRRSFPWSRPLRVPDPGAPRRVRLARFSCHVLAIRWASRCSMVARSVPLPAPPAGPPPRRRVVLHLVFSCRSAHVEIEATGG
jgi:hypothetical protein